MSRIQMLRVLVNERLAAAAEEIFGVFERTIEDYVEEIDRQRKLLALMSNGLQPETEIHLREHLQLLVCEEEIPPEQHQHQRSLSLDQEQPESPQFKEEQEELWTSQEGEQLQEVEEADIINVRFTPVPVKSEHEENPESSWFNQTQTEDVGLGARLPSTSTQHMKTEPDGEADRNLEQASDRPSTSTEHMETEPDGEVWGVSEPDSNLDPAVDTEQTPAGQLLSSDCYRYTTETEDCDAWKETREPQSGSNSWRSKKMQKVKGQSLSISNKFKVPGESFPELKSSNQSQAYLGCKVCRNYFPNKRSLMAHVTGKSHPCNCGLCGKHFESTESLKLHFNVHRKCKVCGKRFTYFTDLERHERVHTGERPFNCPVCGRGFRQTQHVQNHMRIHTGEKPFGCTICGKRFSRSETLQNHMRTHTDVRTFRKGCVQSETLHNNMRIHTDVRTFRKGCVQSETLHNHMGIHTGESPYSCGICGGTFHHSSGFYEHRCRTGE